MTRAAVRGIGACLASPPGSASSAYLAPPVAADSAVNGGQPQLSREIDSTRMRVGGCLGGRYRDLWDSTTANGPADDPAYFPRYSTFLFAEKAVEIISAHEPSKPLFLYLPFQAAHSPMQVPEEFQRQYPWYGPCQKFRSASGTFHENKNYNCAAPAGGLSGGGTQHCACNRLVIAAQVTALDSAILNVTRTLKSTGLWNRTVFAFSGDNGGPESEAHWNGGLRGGKWDNWEGGIRPASFVASPLLPLAVRGRWMNATIHLVDWSATFMALAGLDPASEKTLLDGVNQWPAIAGRVPAGTELRNHTLVSVFTAPPHRITAGVGIMLSGRYKLATMPQAIYGEGGSNVAGVDCLRERPHCWSSDCLLGTGGGWLPAILGDAGAVGENRNMCPTVDCQGNGSHALSSVDEWLCSPTSCSVAQPCLWDVVADSQERHNLGGDPQFVHVVEALRELLVSLNKSVVPPYGPVKPSDPEQLCRAFSSRGSRDGWPYFGPWWSPPSPPSLSTRASHGK